MERAEKNKMTKYEVLKKYFGYDSFREGQEMLVDALLNGQDVLGIMPTGAGKSLCYQIPALLLPGITLVVSPLISLMKDQVSTLNQAGIHAAFLNSSLSAAQYRKALGFAMEGRYKIIYVAPERLLTPEFLCAVQSMEISMISVDEAHCISQWGQDFRPSYLKITEFVEQLPARPVIGAFTATATKEVRDDIEALLSLRDPVRLVTGFDRKNLKFTVQQPKDKFAAVESFLAEHEADCGIIYCLTRKNVEEVCEKLEQKGYSVTRYHAGLSDLERKENQEDFIYDRKQIMVATNAFGMGIDKSNVRYVIHYNMPKNMESYYQEAGRAGRDGLPAECILLYAGQDVITNQFFIENMAQESEDPETTALIRQREEERLKKMTFYCLLAPEDCGEEGPAPTVSVFGGDWAAEMKALSPFYDDPKVVAVGECGLDYHWPVPKDAQLALFEAEIRLALELYKPIIVHDRNAHADVYALLKKYRPKGIVHCYSGSADDAVWLARQGLYFGFGGACTFKGAKRAAKAIAALPLEQIVLETDCPYMAPEPVRGIRCDSSLIRYVSEYVASVKGISPEEVFRQTAQNAKAVYQL